MTFLFLFSLSSILIVLNSQLYGPEIPLQFAGFAAINVPAPGNNEGNTPFSSYSPFLHQLELQQLQNRNNFDLQQLSQQQQSLITFPHNRPLLPNTIPIPKRETGIYSNPLKTDIFEKEIERQHGDFSRGATTLEHATYLSLINDKENFQISGCGWDLIRLQCHDLFGLCKGGCRDFAISINSPIHDCRCIPFGYLALVKLAGK